MAEPSDSRPPVVNGFGDPGTTAPQPGTFGFGRPKPSPQEVAFLHEGADTDQGAGAKHHTLGDRPGQAFPGSRGAATEAAVEGLDGRLSTAEDDIVDLQTGYRYVGRIVYTSSGSFTKASFPYLGMLVVKVQGAGGAGGGATSAASVNGRCGGGAGGYAEKRITDIAGLAASETITVGAAATGGTSTGPDGGASSAFGVTGNGGVGGGATPGAGGAATGGDDNIPGQPGGQGSLGGISALAIGGFGGSGRYGSGGAGLGASSGSSNGNPATGYGAGGGAGARGSGSAAFNGGNSTQGVIIVELWA